MTRWPWARIVGALITLACCPVPGAAQTPDPDSSYYVPQAGLDYANPLEGDQAIRYFRACPNNDDGASLPLNARVKIVVRDSHGVPIAGIPAADLCVLFNGGTLLQGFTGPGADSVIANSLFNLGCPDLRCLSADAPTDANGVAYITFTGPGGIRDPNRKWGHYDSELPVFVSGVKISGRLTSGSANGSYVLRIKNFDHLGGLGLVHNQGEIVDLLDINAIVNSLGKIDPLSYWKDLDGDGEVDIADYNMILFHFNHGCAIPAP